MEDVLKKIEKEKERWLRGPLKKRPVAPRSTDWGDPVEPLYDPADRDDTDYLRDIGFPGEYPFTRGIHPGIHLGRPWTMRQYSGFGTAEETNRRFKYLLEQGQTGLSVAFDLPTQVGYDSDHPMSMGEVGKVGVPVDSLKDMELIFEEVAKYRAARKVWADIVRADSSSRSRGNGYRGPVRRILLYGITHPEDDEGNQGSD